MWLLHLCIYIPHSTCTYLLMPLKRVKPAETFTERCLVYGSLEIRTPYSDSIMHFVICIILNFSSVLLDKTNDLHIIQLAVMETFGCLGAEMALKGVWKCATGVCGALSVEICGTMWMLKLSVTSLDSQPQVCSLSTYTEIILLSSTNAWLGYFLDLIQIWTIITQKNLRQYKYLYVQSSIQIITCLWSA